MNLTLGCGSSDVLQRFIQRTPVLNGHCIQTEILPPEVLFARAFDELAFDISELSFSTYLMHVARGTCGYVGIPVFPSRAFRHSSIYVRADGDIQSPEQLRGRTVGVRNYLNTAALVVRGLLSDHYGIGSDDISWRIGDVDVVERDSIAVPKLFVDADLQAVQGKTLSSMLLSREIDAIVHYHPPCGFGSSPAPIKRLFDDPVAAERDYFKQTGIFPIMHLMGIRSALLVEDPDWAMHLFDAFQRSQVPNSIGNGDYVVHGVKYNRNAIAALCRYAREQGITERELQVDELFTPELLKT